MSSPGYVYVLINQAMPGLVKVGKSARDPSTRALELSNVTGVPSPFTLVYHDYFADMDAAEHYVHAYLDDHRYTARREFFSLEAAEVIRCVCNAPGRCSPSDVFESDETTEYGDVDSDDYPLCEQMYDRGMSFLLGTGEELQDFSEAMVCFERSAKLGNTEALIQIGDMYKDGEGVRSDSSQALSYYKKAVAAGDYFGYFNMWQLYEDADNRENSEKCIGRFLHAIDNDPSIVTSRANLALASYLGLCFLWGVKPTPTFVLKQNANEVLRILEGFYARNSHDSTLSAIKWVQKFVNAEKRSENVSVAKNQSNAPQTFSMAKWIKSLFGTN